MTNSQPSETHIPNEVYNVQPKLPLALNLSGKKVIVTGAAQGVGWATAHAVAALGAGLVVTDRNPLDKLLLSLPKRVPVEAVEADMTDPGFSQKLFDFGPVYGLAHCAAIYPGSAKSNADLLSRFSRIFDVNVRVPLELALVAIEHMSANGGGRIVLVGSVGARNGGVAASAPADYVSSKGALHTLVRNLSRHRVAADVLVNSVAPGPTRTPMTENVMYKNDTHPRGKLAEPEEIAWPIAFLLTPGAANISGAVVDVNGGSFVG